MPYGKNAMIIRLPNGSFIKKEPSQKGRVLDSQRLKKKVTMDLLTINLDRVDPEGG